jgi:hypothetical protein
MVWEVGAFNKLQLELGRVVLTMFLVVVINLLLRYGLGQLVSRTSSTPIFLGELEYQLWLGASGFAS